MEMPRGKRGSVERKAGFLANFLLLWCWYLRPRPGESSCSGSRDPTVTWPGRTGV